MRLRTLGDLRLVDTDVSQTKLLVLLAYLASEGRQRRGRLSQVFWPDSTDPRNQLSQALSTLRRIDPRLVVATGEHVETALRTDLHAVLEALDRGDVDAAADLHRGAFLADVSMRRVGEELEDWIFDMRDLVADRLRAALLAAAEQEVASDAVEARRLAETAHSLGAIVDADPDTLLRLHTVLLAVRSPSARTTRIESEPYGLPLAATQDEALARLVVTGAERNALPARRTSFVGRLAELLEIEGLLDADEPRLITLIGLGGMGKSRLALELAHRQQSTTRFSHGVHFVDLTDETTADDAVATIAGALGVPGDRFTDLDAAVQHLMGRRSLVVLDGIDDVAGAGAIAERLLEVPGVRILATSRLALGSAAETTVPLLGLGTTRAPGSRDAPDAVRLFEARARRRDVAFRLADHRPDVDRLCALTGGSPLALELAASWVGSMPIADIVTELADGLDVLSASDPAVDERHRSVESVLEQSWSKLSEPEQTVMRRLSVFRGGFRRDAASDVTGASLQVLSALCRTSLLRVTPDGRYDRHPLVHLYSRQRLQDDPVEAHDIRRAHLEWYRSAAVDWVTQVFGPDHADLFVRIGEEMPNVSVAWDLAVEDLDATAVRDLAKILVYLRFVGRPAAAVARWATARQSFEQSVGGHDVVVGELLAFEATGRAQMHESVRALDLAERAVTILRRDHTAAFARREALIVLLRAAGDRGDRDLEGELRREVAELDLAEHQGITNRGRGEAHLRSGEFAEARDAFDAAVDASREHGDRGSELASLTQLGTARTYLGDLDGAEHDLRRVRALADRRIHVYEELASLRLGHIALLRGDAERAAVFGEHLRGYVDDDGDPTFLAAGLALLAGAAEAQGEIDAAVVCARDALSVKSMGDNSAVRWFTLSIVAEVLRAAGRSADLAHLLGHARRHGQGHPWELARIEDIASELDADHPLTAARLAAGANLEPRQLMESA